MEEQILLSVACFLRPCCLHLLTGDPTEGPTLGSDYTHLAGMTLGTQGHRHIIKADTLCLLGMVPSWAIEPAYGYRVGK